MPYHARAWLHPSCSRKGSHSAPLTNTCMCPTRADRLGAAQGAEPHRAQRSRLRAGQARPQEEGGGGAGNQPFSCAWPLPTMAHPAAVSSIQLLLLSGSLLLLLPLQCSAMCHMYLYCTLISYLAFVTLDAQGAVGAAVGGSGHGRAGTLCIAIYASPHCCPGRHQAVYSAHS